MTVAVSASLQGCTAPQYPGFSCLNGERFEIVKLYLEPSPEAGNLPHTGERLNDSPTLKPAVLGSLGKAVGLKGNIDRVSQG